MAQGEMEFWRDYPKDVLVDEQLLALTTEEFCAMYWIRQRCRIQEPPGVIMGGDGLGLRLERWSRLTAAQWKKARTRVLAFFELDPNGHLHHKKTKEEFARYSTYCRQNSANASARWDKNTKKSPKPGAAEAFRSLYGRFGVTKPITFSFAAEDNAVFDREMRSHATALHSLNVAVRPLDRSTDGTDGEIDGPAPPLPEGGASAPSPPPHHPPHHPPPRFKKHVKPPPATPKTPEEFQREQARQLAALASLNHANTGVSR